MLYIFTRNTSYKKNKQTPTIYFLMQQSWAMRVTNISQLNMKTHFMVEKISTHFHFILVKGMCKYICVYAIFSVGYAGPNLSGSLSERSPLILLAWTKCWTTFMLTSIILYKYLKIPCWKIICKNRFAVYATIALFLMEPNCIETLLVLFYFKGHLLSYFGM